MAEIPQECNFLTLSIENFVRKKKEFDRKYYITWLIAWLVVFDIVLLAVLFCNCPLLSNCLLLKEMFFKGFVGLMWLTSNHMFGSGNFWDKSPSWFLKILKLPRFTRVISIFSKMYVCNLSLSNMWLLVLIDLANKLYHVEKFLISFYAIFIKNCLVLLRNFVNKPVK